MIIFSDSRDPIFNSRAPKTPQKTPVHRQRTCRQMIPGKKINAQLPVFQPFFSDVPFGQYFVHQEPLNCNHEHNN